MTLAARQARSARRRAKRAAAPRAYSHHSFAITRCPEAEKARDHAHCWLVRERFNAQRLVGRYATIGAAVRAADAFVAAEMAERRAALGTRKGA